MIPSGCYKPDFRFNVAVFDHNGHLIKKDKVSPKIAYGALHFDKLRKGQYFIKVTNSGDSLEKSDFMLSLFAESQQAEIEY